MKRTFGIASVLLAAAACAGPTVEVGAIDQNATPTSSTDTAACDAGTGDASTSGPSTPPPQPTPSLPLVVVDATVSDGGRFTALAPVGGDPTGMYVAETVLDSSGASTEATTLWRVAVFSPGKEKTAIVSGYAVGVPSAMALRTGSTNPADANLIWIDSANGIGALKSNGSSGVTTLSSPFAGAGVLIDYGGRSTTGPELYQLPPGALYAIYAGYTPSDCIARIEDTAPSCMAAPYNRQPQAIFHLREGNLYTADDTQLYVVNVDTNVATTIPLPAALRGMSQPVLDVIPGRIAPGPPSVLYLATRSGVWKRDASNVFTQVYAGGVVTQIEAGATAIYASEVGKGLVRISLLDHSSMVITSDIATNVRFAPRLSGAADSPSVYWISAAQDRLLETPY